MLKKKQSLTGSDIFHVFVIHIFYIFSYNNTEHFYWI